MTNELIVVYSRGGNGIVLIKDRQYRNWKKKDLRDAAEKGYIAGYNKSEPDAYFVIPMYNVNCLTICEGDVRHPRGRDLDSELEEEEYKASKPNPDEKMFG